MDNHLLFEWLETDRRQITMKSKPKGHVYTWERSFYKDLNDKHIIDSEGLVLVKKLVRHWKLPNTEVIYNRNSDSGKARYGSFRSILWLSHNPSLFLICHEVAHLLCAKKFGNNNKHNRKFVRCMKITTNYVRKKYYSFFDIKKVEPIKPELTKQELKVQKIESVKVKINRYEKKIKMYQKKLFKAKRSLTMLQRTKLVG